MEWLVWLGLEVGAYETGITGFISSIVDLIVEWFCSILEATFGVFIFAYEYSVWALAATVIAFGVIIGHFENKPVVYNQLILITMVAGAVLTEHYIIAVFFSVYAIKLIITKESFD